MPSKSRQSRDSKGLDGSNLPPSANQSLDLPYILEKPETSREMRRSFYPQRTLARVEAIASPPRIVLDMDSTEVRVHGRQEQSSYNGHFESTCYHPLLLFNREGGVTPIR